MDERISALVLEAERELARRKMGDFVLYVDHNYRMNWHHRLLCEYLDQLAHKQIRRLMVFMPPRHGKASLFPASSRLSSLGSSRTPPLFPVPTRQTLPAG